MKKILLLFCFLFLNLRVLASVSEVLSENPVLAPGATDQEIQSFYNSRENTLDLNFVYGFKAASDAIYQLYTLETEDYIDLDGMVSSLEERIVEGRFNFDLLSSKMSLQSQMIRYKVGNLNMILRMMERGSHVVELLEPKKVLTLEDLENLSEFFPKEEPNYDFSFHVGVKIEYVPFEDSLRDLVFEVLGDLKLERFDRRFQDHLEDAFELQEKILDFSRRYASALQLNKEDNSLVVNEVLSHLFFEELLKLHVKSIEFNLKMADTYNKLGKENETKLLEALGGNRAFVNIELSIKSQKLKRDQDD